MSKYLCRYVCNPDKSVMIILFPEAFLYLTLKVWMEYSNPCFWEGSNRLKEIKGSEATKFFFYRKGRLACQMRAVTAVLGTEKATTCFSFW